MVVDENSSHLNILAIILYAQFLSRKCERMIGVVAIWPSADSGMWYCGRPGRGGYLIDVRD